MATDSKSTDTKQPSKELLRLVQYLRRSVKELKNLKTLDNKYSNIIVSQDEYVSLLAEKNKENLENYEKNSNTYTIDKRFDEAVEVIFTNFNILSAHHEIFKAYIDAFLDRFSLIESELSKTLISLEKYVLKEGK